MTPQDQRPTRNQLTQAATLSVASTAEITVLSSPYLHIIDILVANPTISIPELAKRIKRSEPFTRRLIKSDAFQETLGQRRAQIFDPSFRAAIGEKMRVLAETVTEKLQEATESKDLSVSELLSIGDFATKAIGLGAESKQSVNQQVVIVSPPKAKSAVEWAESLVSDNRPSAKPSDLLEKKG